MTRTSTTTILTIIGGALLSWAAFISNVSLVHEEYRQEARKGFAFAAVATCFIFGCLWFGTRWVRLLNAGLFIIALAVLADCARRGIL